MDVPAEPILFMKAPTTIVGPDDPIEMPRGGTKLDWEVELAVVIGRRTLYLESADDARECIAWALPSLTTCPSAHSSLSEADSGTKASRARPSIR